MLWFFVFFVVRRAKSIAFARVRCLAAKIIIIIIPLDDDDDDHGSFVCHPVAVIFVASSHNGVASMQMK